MPNSIKSNSRLLRVGVIGTGSMGTAHARAIADTEGVELAAICGRDEAKTKFQVELHHCASFVSFEAMLKAANLDYVAITTPHPTHTDLALQAMEAGVAVLVEKPLAVRQGDARRCVELAKARGLPLGANFQNRLHPARQKARDLIRGGFLGNLVRATLHATDWFRPMAYYQSSPWRATWRGEGGGVITNQAAHDLDLLIDLAGLPEAVFSTIAAAGHAIEVEDEVTGILRWKNGAVGQLHISTREAPGRNFLELTGTGGTLRLEGDELATVKLAQDSQEFSETSKEAMKAPEAAERSTLHLSRLSFVFRRMHENFRDALLQGSGLICPGDEALQEVELANALLVSAMRQAWVRLPLPDAEVELVHSALCANSCMESVQRQLAADLSMRNQTQTIV